MLTRVLSPENEEGPCNRDGNEGFLAKSSSAITVVDETALIETAEIGKGFGKAQRTTENSNNNKQEKGGNNEKKPRMRDKSGKNSKNLQIDQRNLVSTHTSGLGVLVWSEEKKQKIVYSRRELEGLRHVEREWQRKKWVEIYCGLGLIVQQEYDGLISYDHQNQYYNQKQEYTCVDFSGEASILGENFLEKFADNEIAFENPMNPTSDLSSTNHKISYINEPEEFIEDDSDEDYSSIQKRAFMVSGEPDFDSGPPEDGLEYLRRVRWEAAQMPKVKVAKVDRSKLNQNQTIYMPQIPDVTKCPAHLMPLKDWEDAFLADFSELRLALWHYEDSEEQAKSSAILYKEEYTSDLFESSLLENYDAKSGVGNSCESVRSSMPLNCDNPNSVTIGDYGSDPSGSPSSKPSEKDGSMKYPTVSMIIGMDSVARVSMLRKLINVAASTSHLSRDDCLWLFALTAAVDTPLDADTCAAFRSLLRKCASLRAEKLVVDEEVAMLNILATISGRYFGQLEN